MYNKKKECSLIACGRNVLRSYHTVARVLYVRTITVVEIRQKTWYMWYTNYYIKIEVYLSWPPPFKQIVAHVETPIELHVHEATDWHPNMAASWYD